MVNPTITLVSTDTNSTYTVLERCAYFVITTSNANGGSAGVVTNSITSTGDIIDEKTFSGDNNGVIIKTAIIDCVIGDTITTSESNTNCKHTSQIFKFSSKIYSVFIVDTQSGHDSTKTISTTGNVNTAYLVLSACSSYFADTTTSSYNAPLCEVVECPGNNDGYAKSFVRFFEPIQNNASLSVSSYAYNWSGILEVLYKINFVTSTVIPENSGTTTRGGFTDDVNVIISATPKSGYAFDYCILNGYTRLDYIQSSGSQYINTGFTPSGTTRFDVGFNTSSLIGTTGFGTIFGSRQNHYTRSYQLTTYSDDTTTLKGHFLYGTSANSSQGLATIRHNADIVVGSDMHIVYAENTLTSNDVVVDTISAQSFTAPSPIYIFALNGNGSATEFSNTKLQFLLIYDNNVLVRNFIPVIRHIDGAIGLLDLVEMKFYGNSGTGTFIGGDVYDS